MSKLRLIQAGIGGHGIGWLLNTTSKSPDFELAAVVDVSEQALRENGDAAGIAPDKRFSSLEQAMDAVEADALLTVTPPAIHLDQARLAFAHGLHVMTEKPFADTLENAKMMLTLATQSNRQLVVAQNYRYSASARKLKQLIQQDKPVGALGLIHIDFYIPADFTGTFREKMEYVLLVDMAIHHLDLLRSITGQNIARVTARTFRPAWSWYAHDSGLQMLLELEGGLPASYCGDWSSKGRTTSWNGSWRMQCAEGSIHWEKDQLSLARCDRWGKNPTTESIDVPPAPLDGPAQLLANFAQSIRTGQPAETSGQDNLHSFAAVIAAVRSAKEGGPVEVDKLLR